MSVGEPFPTPQIPGAKVLVVSAPYYRAITDAMMKGVARCAEEAGASLEHIEVPGAFELPAAILHASFTDRYDGFIALGCVVRGATSHYDYVCGESARGLMDLSLQGLAVGYGVLTVENLQQAEERASISGRDKGGEVARACFSIIALKRNYNEQKR
jgi:6,7-dimethyl-8-ribityllumazine synthase